MRVVANMQLGGHEFFGARWTSAAPLAGPMSADRDHASLTWQRRESAVGYQGANCLASPNCEVRPHRPVSGPFSDRETFSYVQAGPLPIVGRPERSNSVICVEGKFEAGDA
jgi:hypothetical protein